MIHDLAWAFPRFSLAAIQAFVSSQDPSLTKEEREFYFELAGYLERASETPFDGLQALHDELCCTDEVPGNPARGAAADFIDQVMDERAGVVHVPN